MTSHMLAKTGVLARLIIRRDRVRIPIWLIAFTCFTLIVPISFSELYGNEQERAVMAETMHNPAMVAMVGPGDLDHYTLGAMTTHQMLLLTAVVVGLMNVLLVSRHTRADEEVGRIEMVRSLPAGRLSNLNATLLVLFGTNIGLSLITGFGLYALSIESMELEGSLLYGAALGATGLVFAGVAAVFAQLSESARGTIGYSITVLLVAYLVRAIGDVGNEVLSLVSPLGWVTRVEAYTTNHWWPIIVMVGVSILLWIIANYLNGVRDLEQGFLPSKPGKKHASLFLQSPIGLAFRLQRTGIISWAIGMLVMGASYGSVLGDLDSFFEGNEMMQQMLAQVDGYSAVEQFIPMLMFVMALLATIPPLMAMNKLYAEEKKNRINHLLGRAVSRSRLMASYFLIAIVNGFVMLSLAAMGLWSAGAAVVEGGMEFAPIYGAAISYYPAMLVMISLSVVLIGFIPKLLTIIWAYVFYSFLVLYLGGLFQLSDWVEYVTPFGHISQIPIEDFDILPIIGLCCMAFVLTMVGFVGYNRRDITD